MNKTLVIEKDKLEENIHLIQEAVGDKQIIAVLKGNGYGLGLETYARILNENGIHFFAVSEPEEALSLRESEIEGNILLLTPVTEQTLAEKLMEQNVILTIHSYENAKLYENATLNLDIIASVHIKVDTGFGRFGFQDMQEIPKVFKLKNLSFDGIYSHFSCSFEKTYRITKKQLQKFLEVLSYLETLGIKIPLKHIANSSAALRFPETRMDAVRIGSAFLGRLSYPTELKLNRIAYLESKILTTSELPANHNIGYANTYYTKKPTKIAVIPVGYKDGYMVEKSRDTFRSIDILRYIYQDIRQLGKKTWVEIDGTKYPLLGRVGMYNIVTDITGTDIKAGDTVKCSVNPILIDNQIPREFR